jgi:hypothetical protein
MYQNFMREEQKRAAQAAASKRYRDGKKNAQSET